MNELEYPFDSTYLLKKKRSIKRNLLKKDEKYLEKNIAILSGSTIGEMRNILELFILNHGIKPTFWIGDYNRYFEDAVFDNPSLRNFAPDVIYLHISNKNILDFPDVSLSEEEVKNKAELVFVNFTKVLNKLKLNYKCPIIINNFEPLPYRIMGNVDVWYPAGGLNFINSINQKLYHYVQCKKGIFINDLNYESSWYGLERWFDHSVWYLYKYPFAVEAIPLVCYNIANIIKSLFGKNKKALVVDLDNTIWGGIIGDDGVDNIKLGNETAEGMAYSDIQKYIKKLSQLGIALNVCSKNDEYNAKKGLQHPASLLSDDDFTVFKSNWMNKDVNIRDIALELNLMDDSIVFLDDNPVERELVKKSLPNVSILEVHSPENYIKILDQSGFFEITHISEDDKKRNQYYADNKKRDANISEYTEYTDYLKSLEMISNIDVININNVERVVQLVNKTNQFNLTTIRYSIDEIKDYMINRNAITMCATLKDKYGENGVVSCLMAEEKDGIMVIDLWVMSCRVLKRDLENAIFDELVFRCKERNIKLIYGIYYKTNKNLFVEELYASLGFEVIAKDNEYGKWKYKIGHDYKKKNNVMEVKIIG